MMARPFTVGVVVPGRARMVEAQLVLELGDLGAQGRLAEHDSVNSR
jgi:hypothetical protein